MREAIDTGIGARVRHAREDQHISQVSLARAVGCSPTVVYQLEAGLQRVSAERLRALALALGLRSVDSLLGMDEES